VDWQLILDPAAPGSVNMETDLKLFHDHENGLIPSTLRIYSWQPRCISVGYSQDPDSWIEAGWEIVKRATGGGVVFHNEAEVTYSLVTALDDPLLPKGLIPSYKKISAAIVQALALIGIAAEISKQSVENRALNVGLCFSVPAEYEIVVNGKKIVGSAQKRGKKSLLQQGSIFVRPTPHHDSDNAICVEEVLGRPVGFAEMSRVLRSGFEKVFNISF
jgi:lipoyl(octanoyl) transferase